MIPPTGLETTPGVSCSTSCATVDTQWRSLGAAGDVSGWTHGPSSSICGPCGDFSQVFHSSCSHWPGCCPWKAAPPPRKTGNLVTCVTSKEVCNKQETHWLATKRWKWVEKPVAGLAANITEYCKLLHLCWGHPPAALRAPPSPSSHFTGKETEAPRDEMGVKRGARWRAEAA